MVSHSIEGLEALLRERIGRFLANRAHQRRHLLATLERINGFAAPAFLFGGVIRDLMLTGAAMVPRDVDLVVGTLDVADLETTFDHARVRRNRFGGLHLVIEGWHFDVWALEQTWAFKEKIIEPISFESLPRTTFLNVEAVVVRMDTTEWTYRGIYEHGFFEALLTRTLEINCEQNPYPLLCVLRSLVMAAKLQFSIGPHLAEYVCDHMQTAGVDELLDVQMQHYKRILCDAGMLRTWLATVVDSQKTSKRSPVRLPSVSGQLALIELPEPHIRPSVRFSSRRKSTRLVWR